LFNIVFMGTPEFAVPALQALYDHQYPILQVVTQPDRPKGRGRKPISPPVKQKAEALGYSVMQPDSIKADDVYEALFKLKPDLFVVVAFGHILTKRLLLLPRIGAINIHASLLPKYRGPAPIHRAIIAGETQTGITTMMMNDGLDTGDILMSESLAIHADDSAASLHDRLSEMGAMLLIKTLQGLASNTIIPIAQNHAEATYAPLLKKEEGRINWYLSASELERFIRGMKPWPGAYTFYGDKRIKIFKAAVISENSNTTPGTVIKGFPDELRVATAEGVLSIIELQGESGKRLSIKDFLRGCAIAPGATFN